MSTADIIRKRAIEAGIDPNQALAFAKLESSLGADPKPGNGGGLFQLSPDIWKRHGSGDIKDHDANATAFMNYYTKDLKPGMTASLRGDPTPQQLYLGHQQGVAGATALISNPTIPAGQALSPYYSDPNAPISQNGGNPSKLAGDFVGQINDKYNGAYSAVSGDDNTSQPAPSQADGQPDASLANWAAANQAAGQQAQQQAYASAPSLASKLQAIGKGAGGGSSLGLLAAGQPAQSAQPPAMGMGGSVHAPNTGIASLLNPFAQKKQQQQQMLLSILGGA